MKFLKFNKDDKKFVKMINQSINGFELIILEEKMNDILQIINECKKSGEKLDVVWQMKFKEQNFVHYKNCIFSEPVFDKFVLNSIVPTYRKNNLFSKGNKISSTKNGIKITVSCSQVDYYSESSEFKNMKIKKSFHFKYKDGLLLNRMLKISELDSKNE